MKLVYDRAEVENEVSLTMTATVSQDFKLTRRDFLTRLGLAGLATTLPLHLVAGESWSGYDTSIIIDGLGYFGGSGDPLSADGVRHVSESGLTAANLTLGRIGTMTPAEAFEGIMRDIAYWNGMIEKHPEVLSFVGAVADIQRAKQQGTTGLIYGLQDGVAFETHVDQLNILHQFGIRVIQPTYNRRNLLGDGVMEPANAGLSRSGVAAVERINELGILLDLSHCGPQTTADAIAATDKPFSFTHTGAAAVVDHQRNRTDEEMRACADSGGVVGIYIMPYLAGGAQPTAEDVLRHLDHAFKVVGEDHIGIGTDNHVSPTELTEEYKQRFAEGVRRRHARGIGTPQDTETSYLFAADLNTPRRFETLAGMLLERGYTEVQVEKILGANFLRLFGDVWSCCSQ